MIFEKDTIMGRVLTEVNEDSSNNLYIEQLEELIEKIDEKEYLDYENLVWNKNGLVITDRDMSDTSAEDNTWVYLETPHVSEYSWLVYELDKIYKPNRKSAQRLYTTIGFLMNIYTDKFEDLDIILRMAASISVVWLHPDHIGFDRFMVHPINLPQFGSEF